MSPIKLFPLAVIAILICAGSLCAGDSGSECEDDTPLPPFRMKDVNGKSVSFKDIGEDKVVYLTFWATWCRPCVKELHEMNNLYKKFKDRGFELVAVSIDNVKTRGRVKPFIKTQGFGFPVLMDSEHKYYKKFHSPSPPYSLLVDREGNVVKIHHGFLPGDEVQIEKEIARFLGSTASAPDSGTD